MRLTEAEYIAAIKAAATVAANNDFTKPASATIMILNDIIKAVSNHKKADEK